MCFAKQLFLLFLVNQEKLLVFSTKCLKNLQVTFQAFFQGFYLDFKLFFSLHSSFPRMLIFLNTCFSHTYTVAGLIFTGQLNG